MSGDALADELRALARGTLGADVIGIERLAGGVGHRGFFRLRLADGRSCVARVDRGANLVLTFRCAPALLRYVVEKGSIAVDGVSLTVNRVDEVGFDVAIIPHTAEHTTLGARRPGAQHHRREHQAARPRHLAPPSVETPSS